MHVTHRVQQPVATLVRRPADTTLILRTGMVVDDTSVADLGALLAAVDTPRTGRPGRWATTCTCTLALLYLLNVIASHAASHLPVS
jgi:hypothetical protein